MLKTLRPYQLEAIQKFTSTASPHKLLLSHEMGAGKTFTAIKAAQTVGAQNILVVAPAIVRLAWGRELADVFPRRAVGLIRNGRECKLGKYNDWLRKAAYASNIQVVSFDLLGHISVGPWDMIIIDEIHNLRDPLSRQSRLVRSLLKRNTQSHILGLSGTLIPNEIKNLWNPLDTFWPNQFGRPSRTGNVSYAFLNKYCYADVGYAGRVRHFGFKPERHRELKQLIAPLIHEATYKDFAQYLPPLFVEPLYVASAKKETTRTALEWILTRVPDVTHIGLFTHLRRTARELRQMIAKIRDIPVFVITGEDSTEARDKMLTQARNMPRAILISTTHALNEGISLSFLKAALVTEWVTAMDQMLQFLGRFARQDSTSTTPTRVEFIVKPDDMSRAELISERIAAKNALLRTGRAEASAAALFQEREITQDLLSEFSKQMFSTVYPDKSQWIEEEQYQ
jgi:superfamily II DNA or RNA helicase